MNSRQPRYPALIVHSDGSLGLLVAPDSWSGDVDQWFWSDASDCLIDSEGVRFDQLSDRDGSGRPLTVPEWKCISHLSAAAVYALAVAAAAPRICLNDLARTDSVRERIAILMRHLHAQL